MKPTLKENSLTETYIVDPYQGIVGMMTAIHKEGYYLGSVSRVGEKATVVWKIEKNRKIK
jgi:hypothetical protein